MIERCRQLRQRRAGLVAQHESARAGDDSDARNAHARCGAARLETIAFLLFRVFDIVKPPPIGYLDRTLKNGVGVMLDDLLAAGYTLLVLAIAQRILG